MKGMCLTLSKQRACGMNLLKMFILQIQMGICRARLTNCPGALTNVFKCAFVTLEYYLFTYCSMFMMNSCVLVHYNAYLEYGDEPYDSTYLRTKPETYNLGVFSFADVSSSMWMDWHGFSPVLSWIPLWDYYVIHEKTELKIIACLKCWHWYEI